MNNKSNNPAYALMRNDPEQYELFLLSALDKSMEIYSKVDGLLCRDLDNRFFMNDFESPHNYALYRAIKLWKDLVGTVSNDFETPMSDSSVESMLVMLSEESSPIVAEDNIPELVKEYARVRETDKQMSVAFVSGSWGDWLKGRKLRYVANKAKRTGYEDSDNIADEIAAYNAIIDSADTEDTGASFFFDIADEINVVERIPLGKDFHLLNECLGGGLGLKEHIIFCAPTGGGKTVLACQIASDVALMQKHVLYISTEQPHYELMPRIVSCNCTRGDVIVPFSTIKDGGDLTTKLNDTQKEAILSLNGKLAPYLMFENWGQSFTQTMSVSGSLDATVKKYMKKTDGQLKVVILDWLGAALGEGIEDTSKLRMRYIAAAATMKRIAYKYNVACISLVQASNECVKKNKRKIGSEDLADCKSVHFQAAAAFGISALTTGENAEGDLVYSNTQYINNFKARKAQGKFFPIAREFQYQRFKMAK